MCFVLFLKGEEQYRSDETAPMPTLCSAYDDDAPPHPVAADIDAGLPGDLVLAPPVMEADIGAPDIHREVPKRRRLRRNQFPDDLPKLGCEKCRDATLGCLRCRGRAGLRWSADTNSFIMDG